MRITSVILSSVYLLLLLWSIFIALGNDFYRIMYTLVESLICYGSLIAICLLVLIWPYFVRNERAYKIYNSIFFGITLLPVCFFASMLFFFKVINHD
jgi:hypothetical protein